MEQLSFFAEAGQSKGLPIEMLEYSPGLLDRGTSDTLLMKFIKETTIIRRLRMRSHVNA